MYDINYTEIQRKNIFKTKKKADKSIIIYSVCKNIIKRHFGGYT